MIENLKVYKPSTQATDYAKFKHDYKIDKSTTQGIIIFNFVIFIKNLVTKWFTLANKLKNKPRALEVNTNYYF